MEKVYSVKKVNKDKLPLPPIASLMSLKCKKPKPAHQCKQTQPVFIPKQVIKCKNPSPLLIKTKVPCKTSSCAPKRDEILNSPTAGTRSTFPPVSSPPPPPHLLCGLNSVQTFQQSPTQGQSVDKRGAPIPRGMAPYLMGGFLDQSSIGPTNMLCGPNFQYQQTNFGEVGTVACQTIIYQNTSIISPRAGFRSSMCNQQSAWRSHVTNFSSPETQNSPRSKTKISHNPSSWSAQREVVDLTQFSCDEDLDQLKQAGLQATIFNTIPHGSQQLSSLSRNSHSDVPAEKVISNPVNAEGTSPKRPAGQVTETSPQISKDVCKSYVTSVKKCENVEAEDSKSKTKPTLPSCPPLLADTNKFSNSSGTTKQLDQNKSGSSVQESSDINLFPNYPKIDEIESVGSNDLGVDDAEYHPIALPLGCYQFNDSDTESDTTDYEGSLGRHMAKMGQDKFDLHLDKTLTFMEWSLIPIQTEPTNKSVSDDDRYSQSKDPRLRKSMEKKQVDKEKCDPLTLQQSTNKNKVSKESCNQQSMDKNKDSKEKSKDLTVQVIDKNQINTESCENLTLQHSMDENQVSREPCKELTIQECTDEVQISKEIWNDLKSISFIAPSELEFGQQEEHSVMGNKDAICQDKRITEMIDVSIPVSRLQDDLQKGPENNDISQSTEKENDAQDREKKETVIDGKDTNSSSEIEALGVSEPTLLKSPVVSEELLAVSQINEESEGVLATSSDSSLTHGEHQSKRSSFSDNSDAAIGTHPDNPLTRIATVLSQNLSKTSKDKVGKNVKRLSQNISSAMHKVKGTSENTTIPNAGDDLQKHEDYISDTFTKAQIKEDTLTMTITRKHNKGNVSTNENGCMTPVHEKKGLPPLWHDSKSCSDCHENKVMSSQEKRLLRESADFLGEDFNAFSRRSQRKRGVPKKLENYFSECREIPEDYQRAGNKRKRQRTGKDTEDTSSKYDRTDHDSDWNMVELYQDDVVIEKRNNSATISGVETRNQGARTNKKLTNEKCPEFHVDEEFLLKSTPKCTRNMLKRLSTSLGTSSIQHIQTVLKSQKTVPVSSTTEDNTAPSVLTKSVTPDTSDDAIGPLMIDQETMETATDLPINSNIGDPTTPRTTDRRTALVNADPLTQNCTVYISQEDTVKDVQTQTNEQITCTNNLEREDISTTGEMAKVYVSTGEIKSKSALNKRNRIKLKERKPQKSVTAKKKKGCPLKNVISSKEAAITYETDEDVSGDTREKCEAVENDTEAIAKSTNTSEEITRSSEKKHESKMGRKKVNSSFTGKAKKSKKAGKKKGDLPSHYNTEDNVQAVVEENVIESTSVKKKYKNKNVSNGHEEECIVGDAEKLIGTKKKVQGKKQKTNQKADDSSLLKGHSSSQIPKKVDEQRNDGRETFKKKKTVKNNSDAQKKKTSWKHKKISGESLHFPSKNITKSISNMVSKKKKTMFSGNAKFRLVTDPDQAAELKSNRPTDCCFCKKSIPLSAMKDHKREHLFKCIRCREVFNNQNEKNEHLFEKHKTSKKHWKVSQVPKVNEHYHCMLCEKSFASMKSFQRHLHSNIHGYNRHIQNRCLTMMGSHTQQYSQALQTQGSLRAIGNSAQEVSPDDNLIEQNVTRDRTKENSPKTWTLPENHINTEELKKYLTKTVKHVEGRDDINYYYYEPEFLEWMKKQESILQKMSVRPDSDMHERAESYAVVTNFSMMNYLTPGPQCSSIKYVSEEGADSIQCMPISSAEGSASYRHIDSADGSTSYSQPNPVDGSTCYRQSDPADGSTCYRHIDPADGSTSYSQPDPVEGSTSYGQPDPADSSTHYTNTDPAGGSIPNTTTGCSTNCLCDGTAMASSSFGPPCIQEGGSNFLPNGRSVMSSHNDIMDNSYQFLAEPSTGDQPLLNTSRILSTSSSEHDHPDMDQGQMGWLSRAIQDIEADPYYQVPDFLDSQSDLDNDSGFNEHSVSQDSSVFHITSTPSKSESAGAMFTKNYTDLDNGQQIQVCNKKDFKTGQGAKTDAVIQPLRCPNSSQSLESIDTPCLEPVASNTLTPSHVNTSKQCCESQISNEFDKEDPESQELLKLKYAQILCDIRNDVLGTRSYQE